MITINDYPYFQPDRIVNGGLELPEGLWNFQAFRSEQDCIDCLEDVGCLEEDIEKADLMEVGGTMYGGWPDDRAIIIVKMKDDRFKPQE